jgi:S1-C subfamily serine protease
VQARVYPIERADSVAWERLGLRVRAVRDGLQVSEVRRGSASARIGLARGDALVGVGGAQVRTVEEFRRRIVEARYGQAVLLSVVRGQRLYHVQVPLG